MRDDLPRERLVSYAVHGEERARPPELRRSGAAPVATMGAGPGGREGELRAARRCGALRCAQPLQLVDLDAATGAVRARPLMFPAWATATGVNW